MQPPVPPASSAPRAIPLGDLLAAGGALIVFAFSFAPFVQYGGEMSEGARVDGVSPRFNAWSTEIFMVPLTTFVVVAAMLGIAAVGVRFGLRRELSALGFRMRQVEVGLALFVFVVLLGMIASDKHAFFGARRFADEADPFLLTESRMDVGWGAVLMLVGAMIALAGAVLGHFSIGPAITVGGKPAPPPPPAAPPTSYSSWQTDPGSQPQPPTGWQGTPPPQQPPTGWQGNPPPPPGGQHRPQ